MKGSSERVGRKKLQVGFALSETVENFLESISLNNQVCELSPLELSQLFKIIPPQAEFVSSLDQFIKYPLMWWYRNR